MAHCITPSLRGNHGLPDACFCDSLQLGHPLKTYWNQATMAFKDTLERARITDFRVMSYAIVSPGTFLWQVLTWRR
jgi:hypothetical protein